MDVCLLNDAEVGRLVHYNIMPDHERHTHLPIDIAMKMVIDDELEIVQSKNGGRQYVTSTKLHFLRSTPTAGTSMKVIQRVKSNHLEALKPIR